MLFKFKFICFTLLLSISLNGNEFEIIEHNGKYGLKNTLTDSWTVEPVYEALGWSNQASNVVNNTIAAKLNEKWALINTDGSKITQHIFVSIYPFGEASFIASKREQYSIRLKFGLINRKGKDIIPFDNDRLDVTNQYLIASKFVNGNKKAALLNSQGKKIIDFDYNEITFVGNNRISVTNSSAKSALFDLDGNSLTAFNYESLKNYRDTYFEVTYYGRKGLIDLNGKLIISPIYKDFKLENGEATGLAFTQWDVFEGAKFQQSLFYDSVYELDQNLLAVNSGNTSGILDSLNEYQYYKDGHVFSASLNNLSVIKNLNSQYSGVINSDGKQILPINYDSIYLKPNYIAASIDKPKGNDWQLFDKNGKAISVFNYDQIESFGRILKANRNGKSGLLYSRK